MKIKKEVRVFYAEVGLIINKYWPSKGPILVRLVLQRLKEQPGRVQELVLHETPFQVALQVIGKDNFHSDDWFHHYDDYLKVKDTESWKQHIKSYDHTYLKGF